MSIWKDNEEIQIFREYLRIPSVLPNVNYGECVEFIKKQADDLNLEFKIFYPAHPEKPVVILTWLGTNPALKSIMLNSHMDVTPVFEEYWTHKPFEAVIDESGNIYARGSQDTKCLGTQYLGAIRYFKKNNMKFARTIHVSFVPDEEIGGKDGMEAFVKTDDFKNLNVGFVLDEGETSTKENSFVALYGERANWEVHFKIVGVGGHASYMIDFTAAEKLSILLTKIHEFRKTQMEILEKDPMNFGSATSINATIINGGVQINVVPAEFSLSVDIRLGAKVNHDEFEKMLEHWCEEAGGSIEMTFSQKDPYVEPTAIDESNVFWTEMKKTLIDMGYEVIPIICPGATDARFIRPLGIPAIGFSPMSNVPVLYHDHNEYLPANMYLEGIEVFKKILERIANSQ